MAGPVRVARSTAAGSVEEKEEAGEGSGSAQVSDVAEESVSRVDVGLGVSTVSIRASCQGDVGRVQAADDIYAAEAWEE
jgi:hypothetical protein